MKTKTNCLPVEKLDALLKGEVTSVESELCETHLSECDNCQSAIAERVADAQWWEEAEHSLSTSSLDAAPSNSLSTCDHPDAREETSSEHAADLLQYLGPTDDPRMMGRIGPYEVLGLLGRGGMGVVFKAFDSALNRYVAIKMLLPHLSALGAARKRFQREGQAAAAVVDDHVLPIYAVDEWQGIPYLVMQYCKGCNLQARLDSEGPLETKEVLRIGVQTARGLAAAHAQGLVHRDVKPSNILQDGTVERVMITDFGLARAVDDVTITRTGTIAGTPQYMSPEQACGKSVESESDLFGLGSVLYALCTGKPPFRADNSFAILRQITDENPRDIQELNPDIPSWLCDIIEKLMAKQPNERFASATEVANLLEDCLAHLQHPTTSPLPKELRQTTSRRLKIEPKQHPLPPMNRLLAGLALSLLCIVAGIFVILELSKGTLEITVVDGGEVPILIRQNDKEVKRLTVSRNGAKIRLLAGKYQLEIDDPNATLIVDESEVLLRRGEKLVAAIRQKPDKPLELDQETHDTQAPVSPNIAANQRQYLVWESSEKVRLSHWFEKTLKLSAKQSTDLQELLTTTWQDYVQLEARNLDATFTDEGALRITVGSPANMTSFVAERRELEDRFWTRLDEIVDGDQRGRLHSLSTMRGDGVGDDTWPDGRSLTYPSILGWARLSHPVEIEIRKKGTWFHWSVAAGRHSFASDGQMLPAELQHYYDAAESTSIHRPLATEVYNVDHLLSSYPSERQIQFDRLGDHVRAKWGPHVTTDPQNQQLMVAATALAQQEIGQFLESLTVFEPKKNQAQKSIENLTRIANALHFYLTEKGHFPPAVILGKDGRGGPPHSWRVELLPWIGAEETKLYDAYRFDEAWDSENNKKLLEKMPSVYRCPLDKSAAGYTSYFGFVSDDFKDRSEKRPRIQRTFFWKDRGSQLQNFTDGTTSTLAVVESKREVPWTQPQDIPYSETKPLPALGGWWTQGWRAALADGSVKYFAGHNSEQVVRQLIVINDDSSVIQPIEVRRLEVRGLVPQNANKTMIELDAEQKLYIDLSQPPLITESDILTIEIEPEQNAFVNVELTLDRASGNKLLAKTSSLRQEMESPRLAITFDGKLIMAPKINAPIGRNLVISGLQDRDLIEDILSHVRREIVLNREVTPAEQLP